MTLGVCSVKLT